MKAELLLLTEFLCFLLLLPGSEAYYYYFYSCSYSCIVGAVIGCLTFLGLLIGLIVFLCCYCQSSKKRSVQPAGNGMASISTVQSAGGSGGAFYPQQNYPPAYNQSQQAYPSTGGWNLPPPAGVSQPPDTAYPPPPYQPKQG
ncbi:hypothetical protein BOX15_Mlig028203g1 [Macrostomum lignano]|uniref:Cysteine and tyrosine-rich protein 1 n=1 Tax=Macrostomum lignano TaxID=282301 RepID=A0A267EYJ5_9PLAT|nr:hypothetical protein BOX15_Mlig028203g1 [Macrostomum lignano]